MSTLADLTLVRRQYARFDGMVRADPQTRREIAYFEANIGNVRTADDLLKDGRLYRFAMEAFGLESQLFARALMRKVLSEGVSDDKATANRMTDPKFKEMAAVFALPETGGAALRKPEVVQGIVDRLVTARLEKQQGERNEGVRLALYFQRKAPRLNNWYQVLADKALAEVVYTSLGLPPQTAMLDIDRQKAMFERRMDIADFKDPIRLRRFVERFAAMHDVRGGPATAGSAAPVGAGRGIVVIDPAITAMLSRLPRF